MGVSIVDAVIGDTESVVAFWKSTGLTRPWNDPESDFRLALGGPTSTILLAKRGEELVGSVMVGFDGHRGWVYYLSSCPEHRGEGIGRSLMQAAESWLKNCGAPKIQLMVRTENMEARGFYAALGYELQDVVTIGRQLD